MKWKIIADSGCDLRILETAAPHIQYTNVPLSLQIGEQTFVDDHSLDIAQMMVHLYAHEGKTASACPSPEMYLQSFEDADNIIVVTITGSLSGSYNSAELAKKIYLEEHPEANIVIIDSKSASGEMILLVQAIAQFIQLNPDFTTVVQRARDYLARTKLLFSLARVDNLVKNGRLNKLAGTVVGLLNIRLVGKASDEGTLQLLHKARGQKKAVMAIWQEMNANHYNGGKIAICHCNNPEICDMIEATVKEKFPKAEVQIYPTSGLCSYYAETGGILMGYETN